jgi:hypothetical protein
LGIRDLVPAWSVVRQLRSRDRLGLGAVLGPALSNYTAVLISDFPIPVRHGARRELPLVFAASSAVFAGSAAAMLTPIEEAGPARRLAVSGAIAELVLTQVMKRRLGNLLAEPYEEEKAGRYDKLARVFTGAGAAVMALAGRRSRLVAVAGGAATERWAVFHAGFQSACNPKYTVMPQRERLRQREAGG